MTNIIIKQANSPKEFEAIRQIREIVFQKEQGVDAKLDFDGKDETSDRLIASLNGNFIGTVRIRYLGTNLAKIERLAVLETARGYGIGKKLMLHALDLIKSKNIPEVVIHAQEYIKTLHEQIGFQQEGHVFEEAGIRHVKMTKLLE
ncbi:MAG: GNAT family N-acetyltransferase [Calothrix sp. FI2-JRJ7]|jgi:predicted GNAT family N-acyltransferase|nr:GNAT family N-acetyltransferase [Calothrix sp. FI2-JRJ7]